MLIALISGQMVFRPIFMFHLIIWYSIKVSNSLDFCQEFADNGFNIDYSFGGGFRTFTAGFLVIKDNYWRFDTRNGESLISLTSCQSRDGTGFVGNNGKGYKLVFSYADNIVGFINENHVIEWKDFSDGYLTDLALNSTQPVQFGESRHRWLAFVMGYSINETKIGFYSSFNGSKVSLTSTYVNTSRLYRYFGDKQLSMMAGPGTGMPTIPAIRDIIGIYGPYLVKNKVISNGGHNRRRRETNTYKTSAPSTDKGQVSISNHIAMKENRTGFQLKTGSGITSETNAKKKLEYNFKYLVLFKTNKTVLQYVYLSDYSGKHFEGQTLIDCTGTQERMNPKQKTVLQKTIIIALATVFIILMSFCLLALAYAAYLSYPDWRTNSWIVPGSNNRNLEEILA